MSRTPQTARLGLNLTPVLLVIFAVRESVRNPLNLLPRVFMLLLIVATMLAVLRRTNLFLWYLAYIMSTRSGKIASHKSRTGGGIGTSSDFHRPARPNKGPVVAAVAGALVLLLAFQLMGSALGKRVNRHCRLGELLQHWRHLDFPTFMSMRQRVYQPFLGSSIRPTATGPRNGFPGARS